MTRKFIQTHFKHFNAATLQDAADAWLKHESKNGKMFLAMGGAMSTAEIGISLAEMIRQNKIHAISTTGANLEEDIFNLVAHEHYKRIPDYRSLKPEEEASLRDQGFNRVTDTCIPEEEAMRRIEDYILELWKKADKEKKSYYPHEYIYQLIESGNLQKHYEADPKNSWVLAAYEKKLPIFIPGWEDSTLGNFFVSHLRKGNISTLDIVKSGTYAMNELIDWYLKESSESPIGFFQIGGGIAGDFPICVVPLINQDLKQEAPFWSYFCQISDSTTSYGSYSGAIPNEKIAWGKIGVETPRFTIESDATIVVPLLFSYVLNS